MAIRDFIETDLSDGALDSLEADAQALVETRLGGTAERTEIFDGRGLQELRLTPPAGSVALVREGMYSTGQWDFDAGPTAVPAGEYVIRYGGRLLLRVRGTRASVWSGLVEVTYTPVADAAARASLVVNPVKLAVRYTGVASERIGDHSESAFPDYTKQREALIAAAITGSGLRWA